MKGLKLSLLGNFEVSLDGSPLSSFRYDKVRALLAILVTEAEHPHRRDELVGLLWPDYPEEAARASLRVALASLRESLGDTLRAQPCLLVSRESIQWNLAVDAEVDILTFTRLLQDCKNHPHHSSKDCKPCAQRRTEALKLYRGDLLSGFFLPDSDVFEEWVIVRRENLRRQAITAYHDLADYHDRRGEYSQAEALARHQLELEPWDEETHRQLMRLLYLSDRRSQALAQYELCCEKLSKELGVEPEAATTALFEQIRDEDLASPVARASIALPAARPHNLPPNITPFLGREQELAQIADMLARSRTHIISVLGPGGIGKTRLALQAAIEQLDSFADGVFFVPLEGLSGSEAAVFAIAHALGMSLAGEGRPLQQLVGKLSDKDLLLVLDNYEHLLPETDMLVEMTSKAPKLIILVTSRERLNLRGEQVIDVNGLSLPSVTEQDEENEPAALALFTGCGARASSGFELKTADRPYAAQICRMLDGIPLAIELAAAWLSVLTCKELAQEIERDANILSSTLRDYPERQRSLKAIFDYTWESLTDGERAAFRRLAVFRGGFDRQAAESVAGGSLLILKTLLDKSLIRRNFRQGYGMHELARQYAWGRVEEAGEVEEVQWKHFEYYLNRVEETAPLINSKAGPELLGQLEDDHNNLRAAFDYALESKKLLEGLRMGVSMYRFWYRHDHAAEAHRRLEALLAAIQASGEQFPIDLIAKLYFRAGVFASLVTDMDLAQRRLEEALRLSKTAGSRGDQASVLNSLGTIFFERQDYEGARRMFEEALIIHREVGHRAQLPVPLSNLAEVARVQGDYHTAEEYVRESIIINQEAGNIAEQGIDLSNLGWLRALQGDLDGARRNYLQSIELQQQIGSPVGIAICLEGLSLIAVISEAGAENGARLYGAAEALRKSIGMPLWDYNKTEHQRFLENGRQALGDEAWEKALEEGRQIGLEEAIRLAKNL